MRFILLLLIHTSLHATTFKAQPIENQILESDGVFLGNYLKSKTIKLENGSLATQMVFKMSREVGLQSDLFGMDEIIVHYPGGKLDDLTVKVDGIPEFVPGEKVLLFLKNIENRYWGMNLGFGSFRIVNYGKETVLVNYIYPHDPQIGQVNYRYFEKALKEIKKTSFKTVYAPQYPTSPDQQASGRSPASEGQIRTIASKSDQIDNKEDRPNMNMLWLISLLGISGGIFRLSRRRTSK